MHLYNRSIKDKGLNMINHCFASAENTHLAIPCCGVDLKLHLKVLSYFHDNRIGTVNIKIKERSNPGFI